MPAQLPTKTCVQCGRPFSWRKKWAASWAQVQYCSKGCKKKGPQDPARVDALLTLMRKAPRGTLALDAATEAKLSLQRESLRACARLLVESGRAAFYAKGRRIKPEQARGGLELRLR